MEQYGLDKVIEELKEKGVRQGKAEAEKIVAQAKAQADEILSKAKAEAEKIVADAKKEREATLAAMKAEMAQAAKVGLAAFRRSIEEGFVVPTLDEELSAVISKPSFLETAVTELIKAFAASGMKAGDVKVLLPESLQKELGAFFVAKLKAKGGLGVTIQFSDDFKFGFRIGPKDDGFSFDLTEEGFREIMVRFMSPRFRDAFYATERAKEA